MHWFLKCWLASAKMHHAAMLSCSDLCFLFSLKVIMIFDCCACMQLLMLWLLTLLIDLQLPIWFSRCQEGCHPRSSSRWRGQNYQPWQFQQPLSGNSAPGLKNLPRRLLKPCWDFLYSYRIVLTLHAILDLFYPCALTNCYYRPTKLYFEKMIMLTRSKCWISEKITTTNMLWDLPTEPFWIASIWGGGFVRNHKKNEFLRLDLC